MAGAVVARYDGLVLRSRVEAMKRRSRAGNKTAKARPREALKLRRHRVAGSPERLHLA
jgi:hypothetical protein